MNVGSAGKQILNRPQLTLFFHEVRPLHGLRLRLRNHFYMGERFRGGRRERISISRAGDSDFGSRPRFGLYELRCDLHILYHLQEIRTTGEQRVVNIVGEDTGNWTEVGLLKVHLRESRIVW